MLEYTHEQLDQILDTLLAAQSHADFIRRKRDLLTEFGHEQPTTCGFQSGLSAQKRTGTDPIHRLVWGVATRYKDQDYQPGDGRIVRQGRLSWGERWFLEQAVNGEVNDVQYLARCLCRLFLEEVSVEVQRLIRLKYSEA